MKWLSDLLSFVDTPAKLLSESLGGELDSIMAFIIFWVWNCVVLLLALFLIQQILSWVALRITTLMKWSASGAKDLRTIQNTVRVSASFDHFCTWIRRVSPLRTGFATDKYRPPLMKHIPPPSMNPLRIVVRTLQRLIQGILTAALTILRGAVTWWGILSLAATIWELHPNVLSQCINVISRWWDKSGLAHLTTSASIALAGTTIALCVTLIRILLPERLWLRRRARQSHDQACLESLITIARPLAQCLMDIKPAIEDLPRQIDLGIRDGRKWLENCGRDERSDIFTGAHPQSSSDDPLPPDVQNSLSRLCEVISKEDLANNRDDVYRLAPIAARDGVWELLFAYSKTTEEALQSKLSFLKTDTFFASWKNNVRSSFEMREIQQLPKGTKLDSNQQMWIESEIQRLIKMYQYHLWDTLEIYHSLDLLSDWTWANRQPARGDRLARVSQ